MSDDFDPSKAYHDDWQYQDFIEEVSWIQPADGGEKITPGLKAKFNNFTTSDLQSWAAGIALPSDAAAVVLWEPKPDDVSLDDWTPQFSPKYGDNLRRDDQGGERWTILSFKRSRFGYWSLACEKALVNGTA